MGNVVSRSINDIDIDFYTSKLPVWFIKVIFDQERETLERFLSELAPDDIVFDVGANFGLYSAFAANVVTEGEVIAFEPYPPNIDSLTRTVRSNGLSNVSICEIALGNERELMPFEPPETENFATAALRGGENTASEFVVEVHPADSLVGCGEIPAPDAVKIDVEGAEPMVIDGMAATLQHERCRHLLCELHPPNEDADHARSLADYGVSVGDLRSRIEHLGFDVDLVERNEQIHLRGQTIPDNPHF